jgi:hypothetical protein
MDWPRPRPSRRPTPRSVEWKIDKREGALDLRLARECTSYHEPSINPLQGITYVSIQTETGLALYL